MPDSGDLERRVERLEQLIVELRAELARAQRDTAMAHQPLALRGRANGGPAAPPPDPPAT
jgi:hypothetical protein